MPPSPLSPFVASLCVAFGGGIGALARYHLGRWIAHIAGATSGFPWATLVINVAGCLFMGAVLGWLSRSSASVETDEALRLLLGVGILGGFTTFSTFSAELVALIQRGQILHSFAYGSISLAAGMAAFLIGLIMIQSAP